MKSNKLICHVMQDLVNEVGQVKTKIYAQEFQWKKRMWPISKDAISWKDKKGVSHIFFDVNESDGTIRFLEPFKQNIISNQCITCGGSISFDAKNVWDLLKRKTINTFWGVDSSHIVLLIVAFIAIIACIAVTMYFVGQNAKLQEVVNKLAPPQVTPKMILVSILGVLL